MSNTCTKYTNREGGCKRNPENGRGGVAMGRLVAGLMLMLLGLATGCGAGPRAGEVYRPHERPVYLDRADAGRGDLMDLISAGRAFGLRNGAEVRVVEPGPDWTRVEVLTGRDTGGVGWIESGALTPGVRR